MLSYYLKLTLKSLRRNPVMSTLMVLALGLGIGAFMTTYTVYYLMSGNPIPHKSEQLFAVQLDNWDPNSPPTESPRDVQPQLTWRDSTYLMQADTPAKRQVATYGSGFIVSPEGSDATPFLADARVTFESFFPMFDVPFLYGPPWPASEDESARKLAVISRKLNEQLYAGENSVGRSIRLNDHLFEIVGVLDDWQPTPRFYQVEVGAFDDVEDIFVPFGVGRDMVLEPHGNTNCWQLEGDGLEAFLRSECVWIQFWAELESPQQAAEYQEYLTNYINDQKGLGRFQRPTNAFISDVMTWMDVMGVVSKDNRVLMRLSFLFLLVCVLNTVGLLLAKFLGKAPEVALRRAMGASQGAVFRQNLLEVAMIGVFGGIVGIGLAALGLLLVERLYSGYQHLVSLDPVMLFTAVSLAVVASVLAGLYPVWRATQLPPAGLLKTQ